MHSPTHRRRNRIAPSRGVTLLEVLIALILLAALAAIVAPGVMNRLDERAFETAADTTSEQLMMARAHAQATGEAVEVTFSPSTGQVQARMYVPWSNESEIGKIEPGTSPLVSPGQSRRSSRASVSGVNQFAGAPSTESDDGSSSGEVRSIAEGWATRALGKGIRIGTHRPGSGGEGGDETVLCDPQTGLALNDQSDDVETLDDLANGQEVRLAVFMPDGSAMVGENLWINDEGGRCGRISINPWSGLPMFQRLADLTNEVLGASDGVAKKDPFFEDVQSSAGSKNTGAAWPDDRKDD